MNVKVEKLIGCKCERCYYVCENTTKIFGNYICDRCLAIVFKQLFNNEVQIVIELKKGEEVECLVPVDFTEHKELFIDDIVSNILLYLKEDEYDDIINKLHMFYRQFVLGDESIIGISRS